MKTCIAAAALFICSSTQAFSQTKQCFSYDYLNSEKKIWAYLFEGDNFEYFSDDLSGREVFNTKNQLRRKASVIPIPVLQFDYKKVSEQRDSLQINSLFTPEYSLFEGFLMNRGQLANLIGSSPRTPNPNFKRIESMGSDSEIASSIYSMYSLGKTCIFYDITRHRFSYFKGNDYVYYNAEKKSFTTLTAREYVEDFKRYFDIK